MSQDILIVESDRHLARYLGGFLEEKGYRISYAESRGEGLRLAEEQQPDIILLDLQLPDGDGLELLQSLSRHVPGVSIIVMTASGSIADSVKAMKLGAMDYLLKPIDREAVATLLTHGGQGPDRTAPRPGIPEQIIGRSPPMKRLFYLLDQITRAEKEGLCPAILIQGETGTGKELVAKAIHQRSPRARFP
ncbi:MAG: sigma-54-dependent Fis family transcriptional regulator, partial [Nitrospinota bacterium]